MNFPPPFPLPAFITFHSLSIPSVAFPYLSSPFLTFHRLPSPFNTFRRLSLPFIAFQYLPSPSLPSVAFQYLSLPFIAFITFHRRPISLSAHSLLPRFVLASPHSLTMPRFILTLPRFVLTSPRFVLASPRFVLTSPNSLAMPPLHTLASILLHHPFCFTHPSFTHHCLRPFVLLPPLFYTPLLYSLPLRFIYSHCFASFVLLPPPLLYSFPLFCVLCFTPSPLCFIYSRCFTPLCFTSSPFALLSPIVLHPFFYSPATSANPSPAPQKATFFSFFKEILQKALDKIKKSGILIAMITVNQEKSMQRNTTQRIAIMRNMQSRCDHPTAYDVYDAVKTELPHISLTTVYRLLNSLNREGLLRRIVVEGESDRFDADISGHSHAVCTVCGRIIDCPAVSGDDAPFEKLLEAYGFEALCCDMIFRGVCAGCRQKQ